MKLVLNLDQFLDLVKNHVLEKEQGEIIYNNFLTDKNEKLPYITKKQLKIFRKMGIVKL